MKEKPIIPIPEGFRICGEDWGLEIAEEGQLEHKDWGATHFDKFKIVVDPGGGDVLLKKTVLHELLHVIDHLSQLKLTERRTDLLANWLYAVMVDNPKLCKWLFGG